MHNPISRRSCIELGLFLLLIISIPSWEAPKNILFGLFILMWLFNRIKDGDWGGSWRLFDSLIVLWMGCDILVNLVSVYHHTGFKGAWDLLRYSALLWIVSRTRYQPKHYVWIAATFALSTTLSLIYGYYQKYITHEFFSLDLNSVGSINHSAIYLDLTFCFLLSFLLGFWKRTHLILKILAAVVLAFFAVSLFLQESRAAAGTAVMIFFMFAAVYFRKQKFTSIIMLILLALGAAVATVHPPGVIVKQETWSKQVAQHNGVSGREGLRHSAYLAWKHNPIFGLGSHNYKLISPHQIEMWAKESGYPKKDIDSISPTGSFNGGYFYFSSHAHNLYFTTLADMGLVGFIPMMLVLLAWLYYCVRFFPKKGDPALHWAVWGACFAAWFVNVAVGWVNTTLHHEHAMQSLTMLGLALSYFCRKRSYDQQHNLLEQK